MGERGELFAEHGPFTETPRGSDVVLVRRVVDSRSCAAVRYFPHLVVTHLELESALDYLKKQFVYGRSRRLARTAVPARSVIFRKLVRRKPYSVSQAAALLVLLALAALVSRVGYIVTAPPPQL